MISGSQRIPRDLEVHLVSGAGDLRTGYIWKTESSQGDVGGEDQQEHDHHLRVRCPHHHLLQDGL